MAQPKASIPAVPGAVDAASSTADDEAPASERHVAPAPGEATPAGLGGGASSTPAESTPGQPAGEALASKPRRRELTSLEVAALVREFQVLQGGILDKAYQPSRDEVLLRFRATKEGRCDLYFHRDGIVCFTGHKPDNPVRPPGFAMALRKHACGGRVLAIEQHGFDRVVTFTIGKQEGTFRIVFELFGEGNCVLVRPEGKILIPLVHGTWAHRVVRPGQPYQPPPTQTDPLQLDETQFRGLLAEGNRDLVRALALSCGLGGAVAEEVCLRAGVDKKRGVDALTATEATSVWSAWESLREEVQGGSAAAGLVLSDGRAVDATAYASRRLDVEQQSSGGSLVLQPMPTFSRALDLLFLSGREAQQHEEEVASAKQHATKLQRQLDAQVSAIDRFEQEAEQKVLEGEALFANYAAVERILGGIHEARKKHDWTEIQKRLTDGAAAGNEDASLVKRIDPSRGLLVLKLSTPEGVTLDVPVDVRLSVSENAQAAYARGKKARAKLAGAREALAGTQERAAEAASQQERSTAAMDEAVQEAARVRTRLVDATRHHWFEGYRWFFASSGHVVVAGRDAGSNDKVVKKHLQDRDRYVHADLHGAPSTVVKANEEGSPPEQAVLEAGAAAVTFSRAYGKFATIDSYWVTPPQVSKTPQAGEFLARGAFIVRGERSWMRKSPIAASVGLVWLDKAGNPTEPSDVPVDPEEARASLQAKVMGGPPAAVHRWATSWFDLEPDEKKRKDTLRTLSRKLRADPDAVDRALPSGDCRISREGGRPPTPLGPSPGAKLGAAERPRGPREEGSDPQPAKGTSGASDALDDPRGSARKHGAGP